MAVAAIAFLGYRDVLEGRTGAGIDRLRQTNADPVVNHAPGQRATHVRLLLAAYDAAGDAHAGLEAADRALAGGGTRIWEPEIRRLRATFLLATGAGDAEVQVELARAAAVAGAQGAVGPAAVVERTVERLRNGPSPSM